MNPRGNDSWAAQAPPGVHGMLECYYSCDSYQRYEGQNMNNNNTAVTTAANI